MDTLTSLTRVIISLYMYIIRHHVVYLPYIQFLFKKLQKRKGILTLYGKNEENQGAILKIYPTLSVYFKMLILCEFQLNGKKIQDGKKKKQVNPQNTCCNLNP